MAVGICKAVYPCNVNGEVTQPPLPPGDSRAVSIYFEVNTEQATPPQDQLDLKRDIERALHAITRLFTEKKQESKFRPYYVQLLNLSALGLVGDRASPEIARRALENMTSELIDGEGPAIKNAHLAQLTKFACLLAVPFLVLYAILRLAAPTHWLPAILRPLSIDGVQLSAFMLLWVGCFVGVVLSYGSRTTTMTLEDLIVTDADYLKPLSRHLFAGTLTMVLGLLLCLGIFEVKIAGISTNELVRDPMIAFLIGTFFGMSELLLPGAVARRAGSVLGLQSGSS